MASELYVYHLESFNDGNLEESFAAQAAGSGFEFWRLVNAEYKPRSAALAIAYFVDVRSVELPR